MVICCVCYHSEHITKKCKSCVETYICDNCIISMMENDLLEKCPVCRKSDKWIVSLENTEDNELIGIINNDGKICIRGSYRFLLFLTSISIVFGVGILVKLLTNMCIICDNIGIDIMLTIYIGMATIICILWIVIFTMGCVISLYSPDT